MDKIPKAKNRVGEAHRITNRILVRNDQALTQQQSTFIHEVLHHIVWAGPLRFAEGFTDELEEAFLITVEGGLLELFTRPENAGVRDWLIS